MFINQMYRLPNSKLQSNYNANQKRNNPGFNAQNTLINFTWRHRFLNVVPEEKFNFQGPFKDSSLNLSGIQFQRPKTVTNKAHNHLCLFAILEKLHQVFVCL